MSKFTTFLHRYMEENDLNLTTLSIKMSLCRNSVVVWLNGGNPGPKSFIRVKEGLGLETSELEEMVFHNISSQLGIEIMRYRIKNNLTQSRMASRLGISRHKLSQVEQGLNPTHSSAKRIARTLYLNWKEVMRLAYTKPDWRKK